MNPFTQKTLSASFPRPWWAGLFLAFFVLGLGFSSLLRADLPVGGTVALENKRILILSRSDRTFKWHAELVSALVDDLESKNEGKNSLDIEVSFLTADQLQTPQAFEAAVARVLEGKPCDLIVSSVGITRSLVGYLKDKKRDVPVIFFDSIDYCAELTKRYPNLTGLVRVRDIGGTLGLATGLFPHYRHVAFITGGGNEQMFESEAMEAVKSQGGLIPHFINDAQMDYDHMMAAVDALPPNTILVAFTWTEKDRSQNISPTLLFSRLHHAVRRPIFSISGISGAPQLLGGSLTNAAESGRKIGEKARKILAHASAKGEPVGRIYPEQQVYYNALAYYGLSPEDIPDDIPLINAPPGLWDTYKVEIISVVSMLFVLIFVLFVSALYFWSKRRDSLKYESIFRALPVRIGAVDSEGNLLFLHVEEGVLSNSDAKTIHNIADLPYTYLDELHGKIREVLVSGKAQTSEFLARDRYRQVMLSRMDARIFGKPTVLMISIDIHERRLASEKAQQTAARLRESNAILQCLLDNVPVAIMAKDVGDDFRYVLWNRKAEEISGISALEAIGRTDFDLKIFQDASETLRQHDNEVISSYHNGEFLQEIVTPQGDRLVFKTIKTIGKVDARRQFIFDLCVDITQQRALEDELTVYIEQERVLNRCLEFSVKEADGVTAIAQILKTVGLYTGADRVLIFQHDYAAKKIQETYHWSRQGTPAVSESERSYPLNTDSEIHRRFLDHKVLFCEDLTHVQLSSGVLPKTAKARGLKSLVLEGLWMDSQLWGLLGVEFLQKKRQFTPSDEHLFRSLSHVLELTIRRQMTLDRILRSEEEKSMIMDNIEIPIMLYDAQGNLLHVNRSLLQLVGRTEKEVLEDNCSHPLCRRAAHRTPEVCLVHQAILQKKPMSADMHISGRDMVLHAIPIIDGKGKVERVIQTFSDITQFKQAEEQMRNGIAAAEAANRAKSTFLATMSHEIRTPMNAIIGLSELLKLEKLPPEIAHHIESINISGKALLDLINDVLLFSKIEADALEITPEWMNLNRMMGDLERIFAPLAHQKNISLEMQIAPGLPELYLNEARLRQILINLVGNAVKFTETGGIVVAVSSQPMADGKSLALDITVRDTGVGISQEDQKRIFAPFVQVSEKIRGQMGEGTGLGLSIADRLIKKMGGVISLHSEVGKGSIFSVHFPCLSCRVASMDVAKTEPSAKASFPKGSLVWVVDDVLLNRTVLALMLKSFGAETACFGSGREVLDHLEDGARPDVIFTDIWMPDMNGAQLAAEGLARFGNRMPPLVAVTADAEPTENFHIERFAALLLKPVTRVSIARVIDTLLSRGLLKH